MTTNWYTANTGNHQGLVADEDTGDNIAVCYDKKHADLIAAAPDMLETLKTLRDQLNVVRGFNPHLQGLFKIADNTINNIINN